MIVFTPPAECRVPGIRGSEDRRPSAWNSPAAHLDDHGQLRLRVRADRADVEPDREQDRLAGPLLGGDAAVDRTSAEPLAGAAVAVVVSPRFGSGGSKSTRGSSVAPTKPSRRRPTGTSRFDPSARHDNPRQ